MLLKGYGETAVSDIVKSIEVAQSTFYKYFPSKESVLDALVNRHLSKIYCELEDITESECPPPQKFEQTVFFKATHIDEARELIAAVLSCVCYSIYQNRSEEQLAWLMEIAGDMIASALGLEKDSLHLKV